MSEHAIRCTGLSKQYRIGQQERYKALRDVVADTAMAPFRYLRSANGNRKSKSVTRKGKTETIWALEDVSFDIKHGEVVGIIGRNGAGKSTLLKILSRITKPTRGGAEIHGRVGSLLEVGTGFHPELSGRENIYLNAAILGMRKAEVQQKFDEIVDFAEVEKFIDTPVKRYSSGMHVRLAFAVAAHMETEILLVDEVLAVGDIAFQKKCMGKMGDVARQGRTVLFVSHNMAAVESMCMRGLLIENGKLTLDGEPRAVITGYTRDGDTCTASTDLRRHPNRHQGCPTILTAMRILDSAGNLTATLCPGDDLILEFDLNSPFAINEPTLGVGVDNAMGGRIFSVLTQVSGCKWPKLDDETTIRCTIPSISLVPGLYFMSISVGDTYNSLMDAITNAASFTVEPNDYYGSGRLPTPDLGVLLAQSQWEFGVGK